MIALLILALLGVDKSGFTSFRSTPSAILEGNWESCRESDNSYGERVFDWYDPATRKPLFEFHMGPEKEFALFKGVQDAHRDHGSASNLLGPNATGDTEHGWGRTWHALGYTFRVVLAGGSYNDCESWVVTVTKTTH